MLIPALTPFRKRRGRSKPRPSSQPPPEDDVLTGTVLPYAGSTIPDGYLECDGSAVSRTTYAALFEVMGTAYGEGDGSTNFNLPDFRGRSLLGAGTGPDLTPRDRGQTGGAETHALSTDEMPAHDHQYIQTEGIDSMGTEVQSGSGGSCLSSVTPRNVYAATGAAGAGQAMCLLQPFGVVRWMVKA